MSPVAPRLPPRYSRSWLSVAAAVAIIAACAGEAQSAGVPAQKVSKANKARGIAFGYTVDVDPRWSEQPGYRPVRISITPHEPASVERQFTVVLRFSAPNYYRGGGDTTTVEQRVAIPPSPAGSQPPATRATISVPQAANWNNYDAEFWENGQHRPDLDLKYQNLGGGYWGPRRQQQDEPLALQIDSGAGGGGQFPSFNGGRGRSSYSMNGQQWEAFGLDLVKVSPNLLPEQWINLTSIDVVVLSAVELEMLMASQPLRWAALRSWVLAGGNLWITGAVNAKNLVDQKTGRTTRSEDWSRLTPVDRLLEPQRPSRGAAAWSVVEIGKSRPLGMGQIVALSVGERDGSRPAPVEFQSNKLQLWLASNATPGLPSNGPLIQNVIAPAPPGPFDVGRLVWDTRMGFDPSDPGSDFLNFVIPGVGRVPIYTFLTLMTVFVIVIGPLNYMYLRRRARLHLMIVSVPLCAAIITLGLFSYALASDGLGTRLRVRSYTEIDQRGPGATHAVCWSRLCYYAGLAPSQGLTFSGDVAVLPIFDSFDSRRQADIRQVTWTKEGEQHLSAGWLRSRTLTQFYTVRSRASDARLDFVSTEGLSVTNQLGTVVRQLLATNEEGKLFHGENIALGGQLELAAVADFATVSPFFVNAFGEHRLQRADMPATAMPPPGPRKTMKAMPRSAITGVSVSRMEDGLATALQQVIDGKLPPRSYLAIVERSPELEYGTPSAVEEASFHVIVGRW